MSEILARLHALADPGMAAQKAAYHKTTRPVLGVRNPQINETVAIWRKTRPVDDWLVEGAALWSSGVFEARIAAAKLLIKARLPQHDAAVWALITGWLAEADGWAIADHLADAGGRRIMADLRRLDEVEGWTTSEHLWTKRGALTFTLPLAKLNHLSPDETTGRARVIGWAAAYVPDREWFIQKAVSWWLRTLSRHDPDAVRSFLEVHGPAMKPFARRDAARNLPNP